MKIDQKRNRIFSGCRQTAFYLACLMTAVDAGAQTVNQIDPNGYNRIYYPNGQISSEGYMKDGKPDGYWKTYYVTGIVKSEGNRRHNLLDSTWVFYSETGDTSEIIHYIAGKKSGYHYVFENTVEKNRVSASYLKSKELYVDDKKEGQGYFYFPSGKIEMTVAYKNGKRQGTAKAYDETGAVITVFEFRNDYMVSREFINRLDDKGRKTGVWQTFYDNGAVKEEQVYKDGLLDGPSRLYSDIGKMLSDRTYRDGNIIDEGLTDKIEAEEIITYYADGTTIKRKGIYLNKTPVGMHIFYDNRGIAEKGIRFGETGKKTAEGPVDDLERRTGEWKVYFDSGEWKAKGRYLNDRQHEEWTFYYPNGTVEQSGSFFHGMKDGTWKWFNSKAVLLREENYSNGSLNGMSVHYSDSATVIAKGSYFNDEREGEWTISVGDVREEGEFVAGLKNGLWKTCYDNGKLYHKGVFVQGNPNGRHEFYYPDGTLREEQFYVNGRREGNWKKYNEDGSLFLTVMYRNDDEIRINGIKIDKKK
ncbi:MAG: toxin-antitoxin system YwqK family antitoxin [Bacteroidales bacterium]|jgi:antitoxin component YwqK of YwqJK toxin-antitoxin module|nr:toxin-antitoxin system YwqK family antitoxin [Bacteroidales bacterium]